MPINYTTQPYQVPTGQDPGLQGLATPAANGSIDYSQYAGVSPFDMLTRKFPGGLPTNWDWGEWMKQNPGQADPRRTSAGGVPLSDSDLRYWATGAYTGQPNTGYGNDPAMRTPTSGVPGQNGVPGNPNPAARVAMPGVNPASPPTPGAPDPSVQPQPTTPGTNPAGRPDFFTLVDKMKQYYGDGYAPTQQAPQSNAGQSPMQQVNSAFNNGTDLYGMSMGNTAGKRSPFGMTGGAFNNANPNKYQGY